VVVRAVFEERYWYPDDGGQVWLAGYSLVGEDGRYLARDAAEVVTRGLHVTTVAGAHHRAEALDAAPAGPGAALELRRDPGNEHDPNAIEVLAGGVVIGFVPRDLAGALAIELDAGKPWSAVVLRERRASPRDPRTGVTMLLAPDEEIELRD
jgi:hypothetical protein